MAKFYVESGDLRVVVQATAPIPAAAKALSWVTDEDHLDDFVTVNEQGFIRDRSSRRCRRNDIRLETGTLLAMIAEHELA